MAQYLLFSVFASAVIAMISSESEWLSQHQHQCQYQLQSMGIGKFRALCVTCMVVNCAGFISPFSVFIGKKVKFEIH